MNAIPTAVMALVSVAFSAPALGAATANGAGMMAMAVPEPSTVAIAVVAGFALLLARKLR